ncbi:MAG: sigma-70 family RNA polymerase sigma factor [Flavobacteriaceae bacterium]
MTSTEIWEKHHTDIFRFIFSKVKNEHTANDLTQETFIKAHTKLGKLNDATKVKSWLFTIARNTTLDHFRKNSKTVDLKEFDIADEFWENDTHSAKDCLPGIIKSLPKKYRDPLFLSDIKGVKQAQIAEQLHLPLATVKSQIQRARKLIKQGYMDCCDYTENDKGQLIGETKDKDNCKVCN